MTQNPGYSLPVERVNELSREQFRKDYLAHSRPVVVTGGVREWPALKRWELETLTERLQDRTVEIASTAKGIFSYDLESPRAKYEYMAFSDAAALVAQGQGDAQYYIMQLSIEHYFSELRDDILRLDLLSGEACSPHFWLGGADLVTPLHWDNLHNLYGQVRGRKRFTLFAPAEHDNLYPYPATALYGHMSYANPEASEQWPKLRDAERFECILAPGDLLFLPAFWWHHVRSLELAISVNFWWVPGLSGCFVPAFLRTLRMAYRRERLTGLGAPVSTFPGGPIGAARSALRNGQTSFAMLFAASALEKTIRARCYAVGIDDWEDATPRPIEVLDAELAACGAYPPDLDRARLGSWTHAINRVVDGDSETALSVAEATTIVDEIRMFVTDMH